MRKTILHSLLIFAVVLASGCTSIGPSSLRANRPAYNRAVQQTNDQELLLNLVRSRYRDTLYFTSVERIAATQELIQSVNASAGETRSRNTTSPTRTISNPFSLGGSVSVNEKPTIFYAPVEGEKFVRQMMTPMNPDLLLLLVKSGWSLDRVFALGVAEINGLKNAPTASGPTPSYEPEFRDFRAAIRLLRVLQREQLIELGKPADAEGIELRFAPEAAARPETSQLKTLLRLDSARTNYRITIGGSFRSANEITLATRPLISALNYLSQGVEVPEHDYEKGKVRRTTRADGQPFDWQDLLSDVFRVRVSSRRPADDLASTAIDYRGSWFYIEDSDLETKSTFVLLTQLISLHSAPASSGPALSFSFGK
ncbi:MAG: hypothetical protein RL376_125 [Verrucomicrobiota bacterium]|jgi:hypothetical protein